jgi:hypothetical protein
MRLRNIAAQQQSPTAATAGIQGQLDASATINKDTPQSAEAPIPVAASHFPGSVPSALRARR